MLRVIQRMSSGLDGKLRQAGQRLGLLTQGVNDKAQQDCGLWTPRTAPLVLVPSVFPGRGVQYSYAGCLSALKTYKQAQAAPRTAVKTLTRSPSLLSGTKYRPFLQELIWCTAPASREGAGFARYPPGAAHSPHPSSSCIKPRTLPPPRLLPAALPGPAAFSAPRRTLAEQLEALLTSGSLLCCKLSQVLLSRLQTPIPLLLWPPLGLLLLWCRFYG